MLGLGMDEPEEDDDEQIEVNDVPFIADEDFLLKYGHKFELSFSEKKEVVLTALEAEA
ncbi:iron-sulfur cluster insertion protein [Desulfobaculum bizertense DSM 18034]|uniref:Iron-sulfur cluster insertion protein n=1 Tax=Desulfobaculum bizertense DSM 18034 TaxID=1121442 RepID=A0A1T4VQG7_9BACT|nr:ErpA-related iron-sulfur cluster insertion protein [Desulfobaculum bizertense]SKA67159.1 iron-sulfur cluster insertion protein [Desulfobaculum bizertense DSM 18034]